MWVGACFRDAASHVRQVHKDVDLRGMGDLLANSQLARSYAKSMYSNLSEQTLRPGRFQDQRAECLKAKVSLGEYARQAGERNCDKQQSQNAVEHVWRRNIKLLV